MPSLRSLRFLMKASLMLGFWLFIQTFGAAVTLGSVIFEDDGNAAEVALMWASAQEEVYARESL